MTLGFHTEAVFLVQNYKKNKIEILKVLERIDADKTYLAFGVSSLFRYCVEVLGLSEYETYEFVKVTRTSKEMPLLKSAIEKGEITLSKVARIASVLTTSNQATWINIAKTSTQRELEREVAKENPKPLPKERIKVLTELKSELRLSISIATEKKLKRAQEVLKGANLEDTLEKLLDFALSHKDPVEKAKRQELKKEVTSTPSTRRVPNAQVSGDRVPLTASQKHQVFNRDKGRCTFKNCGETRWVQIHHVIPVSQGGTNELSNLTILCYRHHALLHSTEQRIHTSSRSETGRW